MWWVPQTDSPTRSAPRPLILFCFFSRRIVPESAAREGHGSPPRWTASRASSSRRALSPMRTPTESSRPQPALRPGVRDVREPPGLPPDGREAGLGGWSLLPVDEALRFFGQVPPAGPDPRLSLGAADAEPLCVRDEQSRTTNPTGESHSLLSRSPRRNDIQMEDDKPWPGAALATIGLPSVNG